MTQNTKAFDVSKHRGIVVVTPLGDTLSFRDIDIHRESDEITEMIRKENLKRLVIDLGHSNYFGSIMIGMINSFGQLVKEQGGQMFLCNASDDMQAVLKIMKIDTLWPHFPTQAKAIKAARAWKPE